MKKLLLEDELQRQAYILRALLLGSLALSLGAAFITGIIFVVYGSRAEGSFVATLVTFLFFTGLYWLLRRGAVRLAAHLFALFYTAIGALMVARWGILLPQAVLLFALAIFTSSILLGTRGGALFTLLSCIDLIVTARLHRIGVLTPDREWMGDIGYVSDAVVFSFTFLIFFITAWLSNREITRSLQRTKAAEAELKRERDHLEVIVDQRTRQLREQQQSEMMQLYEFAYFGRITASLLHDMVSPLSTVALSLKRLKGGDSSEIVTRAIENTRRIERYVAAARQQLRREENIVEFSLTDELRQAVQMLEERLRRHRITIQLNIPEQANLSGDSLKFYRLVTNLLSNGIDACAAKRGGVREIRVDVTSLPTGYRLVVRDTGSGISKKVLKNIFTPFFTTKAAGRGSGIGLAICKEIVEHDFGGSIAIESVVGVGTSCTVELKNQR